MRKPAPIVLFAYNRLTHLRETIASLQCNELASESELTVYCDGPARPEHAAACQVVQDFARRIDGFRHVEVIARDRNLGLARSIITGVSAMVSRHGRVIVLEDDLVTSPYFLRFMNDGIDAYETCEAVVSVHGYAPRLKRPLGRPFFLRGADCWGWATWTTGWACFDPDAQFLLDALLARGLDHAFDFQGSYPFTDLLRRQIAGQVDSWAIRWYASAFLRGKLTLHPHVSVVRNIGLDGSGTHCAPTSSWESETSSGRLDLEGIDREHSDEALAEYARFYRDMLGTPGETGSGG